MNLWSRVRSVGVRSARGVTFVVALVALVPGVAAGEEGVAVPVEQLLASSAEYDGEVIVVEGELIGDYGSRRDGTMWTQLNDDSYTHEAVVEGGPLTGSNIGIGVRMTAAMASDLDPAGGYRLEGPVVRLTGVWRHHDPDRGGESYLDVTDLSVVIPGRRLEEGPDWLVLSFGVVLLVGAVTLWARRPREE